jgi:F-type H+-transporting ATPase subunit delta
VRPSAPVARRYAKALYGLAREAGHPEPVADELERFAGLLESEHELREVLTWPWVKATAKRTLVVAVAERLELSPLTRRFLALVAQRRRLALLPDIVAAYRGLVDEAAGRVRARVRTAVPLPDGERAALREGLGRRLGRGVLLETEVDPVLVGGFVVEVGSQMLDASIEGRLRALRAVLTKGAGGAA